LQAAILRVVGVVPRGGYNLVYVIVGEGLCRQSMEDFCVERRLVERFRFIGWVDYARLPRYMNLADLVIMPSESDGLARVYLEAQACARLLVAATSARPGR
jgi:teichuronic acid biosynthesis glycosyltransferase TuaC